MRAVLFDRHFDCETRCDKCQGPGPSYFRHHPHNVPPGPAGGAAAGDGLRDPGGLELREDGAVEAASVQEVMVNI